MNKRIKKKVTRRALDKYYAGEKLTYKEYKLIDKYIFVSEFDFDRFYQYLNKAMIGVRNTMADIFENLGKSLRVRTDIEVKEQNLIDSFYAGTNPND